MLLSQPIPGTMPSATTTKTSSSGTKRKADSTKSGRSNEGKKPKTDVEKKASKSKKAVVKAVEEPEASGEDDFDAMDEDGGAPVDGEAEDVEMGDDETPLAGLHPDRMKAVANGTSKTFLFSCWP